MMQRRTPLQWATVLGASWAATASTTTMTTTLLAPAALSALQPSPRMPVVFIGHGSPMNAIEDNRWHQGWQALGQTFGEKARYPRPQLILCVSAHWLTRGWHLTGMRQPRTIHDFGGFPRALFEVQYPAPGAPAVAQHWAAQLRQPHNDQAVVVDEHQWGLDHGSWSVLLPMFPKADIPVMQLSMDYSRPLAEHWALGEQLRVLRDRGVLIVGSGNIVHNLRAMATTRSDEQEAHDWALEFDAQTTHRLNQRDHAALTQVLQAPQRSLTQLAHPSHEHYLPLLYAAGASHPGEVPRYFNEGHQMAAISMRSAVWG